jgi:hypothetical protein
MYHGRMAVEKPAWSLPIFATTRTRDSRRPLPKNAPGRGETETAIREPEIVHNTLWVGEALPSQLAASSAIIKECVTRIRLPILG